jgi:hypothetical protein
METVVSAVVNQAPTPGQENAHEVHVFLSALSIVLQETVGGFERAVARITDLIVTGPEKDNLELVVALQAFDRLQQEFTSLSETLARIAATSSGSWAEVDAAHPSHEAIASIPMSELKSRLQKHLKGAAAELVQREIPNEVVF